MAHYSSVVSWHACGSDLNALHTTNWIWLNGIESNWLQNKHQRKRERKTETRRFNVAAVEARMVSTSVLNQKIGYTLPLPSNKPDESHKLDSHPRKCSYSVLQHVFNALFCPITHHTCILMFFFFQIMILVDWRQNADDQIAAWIEICAMHFHSVNCHCMVILNGNVVRMRNNFLQFVRGYERYSLLAKTGTLSVST